MSVGSLEEMPVTGNPRLRTFSSLRQEFIDDCDRRFRARAEGRRLGPVIPLAELMDRMPGDLPVGIVNIQGPPGIGKTALAIQTATHCGCPSLFVSCECDLVDVVRRVLASVTGRKPMDLQRGKVDGEEAGRLFSEPDEMFPNFTMVDGTMEPVCPEELEELIEAMKFGRPSEYYLVVIDSIQSWANAAYDTDEGEYIKIGRAMDHLHAIAYKHKVTILILCEQNRASRKGEVDVLSAGAGSRKLEYVPEVVVLLSTVKDPENRIDKMVEVNVEVAKNRSGPRGLPFRVLFDGPRYMFHDHGQDTEVGKA